MRTRVSQKDIAHYSSLGQKHCSTCKEWLDYNTFNSKSRNKDGRHNICRPCQKVYRDSKRANDKWFHKKHDLKKHFDMTVDEYNEMHKAQGGVCRICKEPETLTYKGQLKYLAVDHCHSTGKIRGLLCSNCNQGLGRFKDNKESLRQAIEYLQQAETKV